MPRRKVKSFEIRSEGSRKTVVRRSGLGMRHFDLLGGRSLLSRALGKFRSPDASSQTTKSLNLCVLASWREILLRAFACGPLRVLA
jgi:hypothetical protein